MSAQRLFLALFTAALALFLPPPDARAAPRHEQLQVITCERPAAEYLGTLRARVVLHRAFLATGPAEAEEIQTSIKQHLRYLWGHYRTDEAASQELRLVLSAEEPEIKILRRSEVPYGRDLVLDWQQRPADHLLIEDPYTLRAIRAGRTRRDDPAVAIDYEIRFKVGVCSLSRTVAETARLDVPLPQDPWLFFWHVAAADRRPMTYAGVTNVTNPCSDDDFAELPHPFYYWYDWQPKRHGPDASGAPFDCRRLLVPGRDFQPFPLTLTRHSAATRRFASLRAALTGPAPARATVLLGVLDHQVKALDAAGLRRELTAAPGPLPARAAALLRAERERGTEMFLRLLQDLPEVATVGPYEATVDGNFLRVAVELTLQRSKKPLKLSAYLGLTDLFGPVPPTHFGILRRALAEDNLIIYAGHSGIGENFRLAQIERNLRLPHDDFVRGVAGAPHQLIAFLSCYSYMYFGQDLLAAGASRPTPGGEFVFTGDAYTKGNRGALALLDLLDQVLAPTNREARVGPLRYLDPEDFWLIKELKP